MCRYRLYGTFSPNGGPYIIADVFSEMGWERRMFVVVYSRNFVRLNFITGRLIVVNARGMFIIMCYSTYGCIEVNYYNIVYFAYS